MDRPASLFRFSVAFLLAGQLRLHALDCGYPGLPFDGAANASLDWPDNRLTYRPGTTLAYGCRLASQVLRGRADRVRVCRPDGRWTGRRPWCDVNLAYGKKVHYLGTAYRLNRRRGYKTLLTDGLVDVEDQECPTLAPGSAVEIDLNATYPIRSVVLQLNGNGRSLEGDRLSLEGDFECRLKTQRASPAVGVFVCADAVIDAIVDPDDPSVRLARTVRYEHSSNHSISLCEISVFANQMKFHCGLPEIPANGRVDLSSGSRGERAAYGCAAGYRIEGDSQRTCEGRHWQGPAPVCAVLTDTTLVNDEATEETYTAIDSVPSTPDWQQSSNSTAADSAIDPTVSHWPWIVTVVVVGSLVLILILHTAFRCYHRVKRRTEPVALVGNQYVRLNDAVVTTTTFDDPDPDHVLWRPIKRLYQILHDV